MVKSIVAYHPEILVRRKSGVMVRLKVDMDDWYGDEDVNIRVAMAAREPLCETYGELVELAKGIGELSLPVAGVIACCIEDVTGAAAQSCDAKEWDDLI